MGRESREVWEKRVARWRDSGLSAREFADEVGVNVHTLSHWAWQLGCGKRAAVAGKQVRRRPAAAPAAAGSVTWLEVVADAPVADRSAPTPAAPFEVVLDGGRTIRVPAGFDAETLQRLLAVVEAR